MNPAVRVHHAVPWILVHAGGTEEVMRAVELPGSGAGILLHGDEISNPGGLQLFAENFLRLADAAQIQFIPPPEHLDFSLAVSIGLLLQHNSV